MGSLPVEAWEIENFEGTSVCGFYFLFFGDKYSSLASRVLKSPPGPSGCEECAPESTNFQIADVAKA